MWMRVRLAKTGRARFLSHLDLQRAVERILRRADLPIAFSQGFNPHPRVSFGSALATGTSSEGEFLDVELTRPVAPEEFVARTNAVAPAGLRVLEARRAPEGGASLAALLDAAEYRITLEGVDPERLARAVEDFLAADEVVVTRTGKSGPRPVNIRPQVYHLEMTGPGELRAVVQTGPRGNLKPEDLVAALRPAIGEPVRVESHRLMLYRRDPETGALTEPWSLK